MWYYVNPGALKPPATTTQGQEPFRDRSTSQQLKAVILTGFLTLCAAFRKQTP